MRLYALPTFLWPSRRHSVHRQERRVRALPQEIQTKLDKNYPDWQPEKLEDLYEDDRQFWIKAHPGNCPGIAIGHFELKTELSYALLLIPSPTGSDLAFASSFSHVLDRQPYMLRI